MSVPVTAGIIIGAAVLGGVAISMTSSIEAKHRADAAAENAALAAADSYFGWASGDPCTLAGRVAELSDTELVTCEIRQFDVVISLRVHRVGGGHIGVARAGVDGLLLGR